MSSKQCEVWSTMAQRITGYARIVDEQYETVTWPVLALLQHLPGIRRVWDPCDRGNGKLVDTLLVRGIDAFGTEHDFLTIDEPPCLTDAIVTNPPYGDRRRGEMAVAFIEHALALKMPHIAMLLRARFRLRELPTAFVPERAALRFQADAAEPHQVVRGSEQPFRQSRVVRLVSGQRRHADDPIHQPRRGYAMRRSLGVDPGIRGGLAIVDLNDGVAPQLVDAIDIPVVGTGAKERVDVIAIPARGS